MRFLPLGWPAVAAWAAICVLLAIAILVLAVIS
jgi:hypothetical protein